MYKHDFIRLSEAYLDATIFDSLLEIDGYNLVQIIPKISEEVELLFTIKSHSLFEL